MSERECRTFEKKLAHFTAPTLLGIKCASLVSLSREEFDIPAYAAAFNAQAVRGGLQMQIMCRCQKRQLVLLYRPKLLQKRLEQPEIRRFLLRYGYTADMDLAACLMRLQNRIAEKPEFPHEIGLFLSYPPEDVKGFIEHHAADFKYAGLWKVYGDEQRARDLFAKYQRCTEIYCQRLHAGSSIAQLAVNVQQRNTAQNERMLPS